MSFLDNIKRFAQPYEEDEDLDEEFDDELDEEEEDEEEEVEEPAPRAARPAPRTAAPVRSSRGTGSAIGGSAIKPMENSNLTSIAAKPAQTRVVLCQPKRYRTDVTNMADQLEKGATIVMNLETTDDKESRRILDFMSGVAYAHKGDVRKVSSFTYVVMPMGVEFSGELVDAIENSDAYKK